MSPENGWLNVFNYFGYSETFPGFAFAVDVPAHFSAGLFDAVSAEVSRKYAAAVMLYI